MKKKLLAAAIMAAMTLSASAALAAPVISGDAQLLTQKNKGGSTFSDVRLRLNADADLGGGIYAHGRIMGIDMQGFGNTFENGGTGSTGAKVNMEQMYLGAKVGAVDVKVGRQALGVGNGMLADVNGIEGISLATAGGNVTVDAFVGRDGTNDVVAGNIGTNIEGITLGAGIMSKENVDYMAVNASKKINNITLGADYVKNTDTKADGYLVKATVGEIAKKGDFNYALSYRNIEDSAVDGGWVTNGAYADSKGFRVAANYKVTDNATLSAYQDITKQHSDNTIKPNQARVELNVNF